ncbi:MAG TPA: TonB C-terminal domain-containing protein [Candidatus Acidoferrum sp.]
MIPRFLVPFNARPPVVDATTSRRRPSTLDERTLVPAMLPIVPLDGHSNIPSSLPLEAIAARTVVPRGLKREDFAVEEPSNLPLQPTDMDERVTVPQGAAPPEIIAPSENILPAEIVDPDIFLTGEVNLLTRERTEERAKSDLARNISSVVFHILLIVAILVEPKVFPARPKTQADLDLARRQMTILLPPGAFETPRPTPRRERPPETMKVDPRILRKVAPPEPQPQPAPPAPKQPERVVKELPSAPVPQPNATPPPETTAPTPKTEIPKSPPKLETPEEQPRSNSLLLPRNSPGRAIQDSMRDAAKMNAPRPIGGGQVPTRGAPGGGGRGTANYGIEMLTPTEGVDFNDYLARVYQSVKRNWYAVMPASVELGDKGVVSLQFRILKNGGVPDGEPVKVFGSGKDPLDRAAISSIRASNPFEPLPPAFSGPYIELRFTYYYNLQPDYTH